MLDRSPLLAEIMIDSILSIRALVRDTILPLEFDGNVCNSLVELALSL